MITHLAIQNLKKISSWSGDISRVTLFCGPNRSCKTAAMEGARLALTNVADIGAAVNKQALLTSGLASAVATGPGLEARWQYAGKRTHSISCEGMEVKSVVGDCPVTVEGYWQLTGEQRWALVESVVGAFSETAPPSVESKKEELKQLQSVVPPEPYQGDSIAVLTSKIADVEAFLSAQKTAQEDNQKIQREISEHDAAKSHWENAASDARKRVQTAQESRDKAIQLTADCEDAIDLWRNSPGYVFTGMGHNLAEVASAFVSDCKEKLFWLERLLEDNAVFHEEAGEMVLDVRTLQSLVDLIRVPEELEAIKVSQGKEMEAVVSILTELGSLTGMGCNKSFIIGPSAADAELKRIGSHVDAPLKAAQADLLVAEAGVQKYSIPLATKPLVEVDDEALIAKTLELESLKTNLSEANSYRRWVSGMGGRNARIVALESAIRGYDDALKAYQKRRADYLDNAANMVSDKANQLLKSMQLAPVTIEIATSGKRPTLTATAGGVDISAMSGMEKVSYGIALLNAFQELTEAKCPMLFIEASELDDVQTSSLISGLARFKTKGNALLCHWSDANGDLVGIVEGFTCHVFGV